MRLSIARGGRGDAIPSGLTTLSVSWLNGQFKALAVHRGVVRGTWERTGDIEDAAQFAALLREAAQQTGYHGQTVTLLLAHPRLAQQVVDVPPVKGTALQRILQRQVQQQKIFVGEAAWVCQNSLSGKSEPRVVMHLLPAALLNELLLGCRRNGMDLAAVLPVCAALHRQSRQLPLGKGDIALLAGETGGLTTVVVSRGDGHMLLGRTLPGTWNDGAERLAMDLNRTILFMQQKYGVTINKGIWLSGSGAEDLARNVQQHLQLPVGVGAPGYEPFYWARQALTLRPSQSPNFISPELQMRRQRRVFAEVVAAASVLVALALISLVVYASLQARQEAANIAVLSDRLKRLQARQNELQQLAARLSHEKQVASLVLNDRPPPVPAWFLGYLSEVVPAELVVTNLHVQREENCWRVRLAGGYQPAIGNPTPAALSNAVSGLSARLANGPFHVKILTEAEEEKAGQGRAQAGDAAGLIPTWVANVSRGIQAKPAPTDRFTIEGLMR
jgi:hypothetical protein